LGAGAKGRAPRAPVAACGEGQNRTADTAIFSRVLYQLSYLASKGLLPWSQAFRRNHLTC
jgi:hypothetical protein